MHASQRVATVPKRLIRFNHWDFKESHIFFTCQL